MGIVRPSPRCIVTWWPVKLSMAMCLPYSLHRNTIYKRRYFGNFYISLYINGRLNGVISTLACALTLHRWISAIHTVTSNITKMCCLIYLRTKNTTRNYLPDILTDGEFVEQRGIVGYGRRVRYYAQLLLSNHGQHGAVGIPSKRRHSSGCRSEASRQKSRGNNSEQLYSIRYIKYIHIM